MKRFFLIPAIAALLAFAATPVSALTITPATPGVIPWLPPGSCDVNDEVTCLNEYLADESLPLFTGDLLYKAENPGEEGTFQDNYSTEFFNEPTDPEDATISWDGGSFIACPICWLIIKDGNNDPIFYFYNLGAWDGQEDIVMTGFWPEQGAISHVSIWGGDGEDGGGEDGGGGAGSTVPEPAVLTLFGLGLALVASRLRRH